MSCHAEAVQAVAEALVAHTRLSSDGQCSCGHVVPLGHSFAEHQAEAVVAAARPAIEREAKAAALREAAEEADRSVVTGKEVIRPDLMADWLRARADRIEREAL